MARDDQIDPGTEVAPDNASGKHLLIEVPEYGKDPVTGQMNSTYLRLGAAADHPEREPGADLVDLAQQAGPGDHSQPFDDDHRQRTGAPTHTLGVGEREAQSKVLVSRGGWRDHSDGNRITTTRGDKVEVIRGNYKMVVLGRQDDPDGAAGWDVSGQSVLDFAAGGVPGSTYEVIWGPEYGGSWTCNNSSVYGVVNSLSVADTYGETYGNFMHASTGSESPTEERPNPEMIDKTWAKKIESYTGSPALPVALIHEETFAGAMVSVTTAGVTNETTTVAGAITSITTAGSTMDTTTVTGAVEEVLTAGSTSATTTVAGNIHESTTAGTMTTNTSAGAIAELTSAGAIGSVTFAGDSSSVLIGGSQTDVTIVGAQVDVLLTALSLSVFLGLKLDVTIAGAVELNLSAAVNVALLTLDAKVAAFEVKGSKIEKATSLMFG